MKIGLYFGSFNPIHIGHMAIANYMIEFTDLEQLWFVVSPQNPLKKKQSLLDDFHRLELVERVVDKIDKYRVSNMEFRLPKPSFTIDTLTYLYDRNPGNKYVLIMGTDSLESLHRWKNYEQILKYYEIFAYPRPGKPGGELKNHPSVTIVNAPLMEISSSFIRKAIKQKKDVRFFLPEKAYTFIKDMHFYE